jgi:hypothetical protein
MTTCPNKAKQLALLILDFSEAVNRLAQSSVEERGKVSNLLMTHFPPEL